MSLVLSGNNFLALLLYNFIFTVSLEILFYYIVIKTLWSNILYCINLTVPATVSERSQTLHIQEIVIRMQLRKGKTVKVKKRSLQAVF